MAEKDVGIQPVTDKITISTGSKEWSFSRNKLVIWFVAIVLGVAIVGISVDHVNNLPTQSQLDYYMYKSGQYQNVLTNLMRQFQNVNPVVYNDLVKGMNSIAETAGKIGKPIPGDRAALIRYILDSSVIAPEIFIPENNDTVDAETVPTDNGTIDAETVSTDNEG